MNADFRIVAAVMVSVLTGCATPPPPEPPKHDVYGPELPPPKKPMPNQIDGRWAGIDYHCAAIADKGHNGDLTFLITAKDSSGEWRIVKTPTLTFFTHKLAELDALAVGVISRSEEPIIYNNDTIVNPVFAQAAQEVVKQHKNVCRKWWDRFMNNDPTLKNVKVKTTVSPAQLKNDQLLTDSVRVALQLSAMQGPIIMNLRRDAAPGPSPR